MEQEILDTLDSPDVFEVMAPKVKAGNGPAVAADSFNKSTSDQSPLLRNKRSVDFGESSLVRILEDSSKSRQQLLVE